MNPYPKSVTPSEKKMGFVKVQIDSGYEGFAGPEMWEAWAYKVSKSDYFVKTGEGQYKQMRYGYRATSRTKKVEWFPIGDDFKQSPEELPTLTLEASDFLRIVGVDYGGS
ncbi:MAG TPA: hypothetical protein VIW67_09015 [Terriglobales bacterium]|jgi:hypothetical protein